jgi:Methane oxygenase PmoA
MFMASAGRPAECLDSTGHQIMTCSRRPPTRTSATVTGALLIAALGLLLSGRTVAQQPPAPGAYSLAPVANGMQLKTPDGRVVFEYLTQKPADSPLTSPSTACFHPVNTPSGERLTALAPDDHPHHRGMYLAWHDAEFRQPIGPPKGPTSALFGWNITKVDFWGWGQYAPRDGRVIQNRSVKMLAGDAARAQVEIHNDWTVGAERPRKMLDETTLVTVAERDGVYVLDLSFRLDPLVDYQMNKQSFSGFNLQARKDGPSKYTNAAGTVPYPDPHYSVPELNWPPAPWYGYVITLGSGKTIGAAVLDHPSNPPATWHNSRSLWMLNPNIAALGPVTIRVGAPLTLRYRVVVHDGETPTAVVQKLSEEWRATK